LALEAIREQRRNRRHTCGSFSLLSGLQNANISGTARETRDVKMVTTSTNTMELETKRTKGPVEKQRHNGQISERGGEEEKRSIAMERLDGWTRRDRMVLP